MVSCYNRSFLVYFTYNLFPLKYDYLSQTGYEFGGIRATLSKKPTEISKRAKLVRKKLGKYSIQ